MSRNGESIASKIVVGVAVAVITALIVAYLEGELGIIGGGSDTATDATDPPPTATTAPPPTTDGAPPTDPPPTDPPPTDPPPTTDSGSCTVTITNPLVTAFEEPDTFGLEVGTVPPGTHGVLETRVVTFAGSPQRWFRIAVGSSSGWIMDSTILIESKSPGCAGSS